MERKKTGMLHPCQGWQGLKDKKSILASFLEIQTSLEFKECGTRVLQECYLLLKAKATTVVRFINPRPVLFTMGRVRHCTKLSATSQPIWVK